MPLAISKLLLWCESSAHEYCTKVGEILIRLVKMRHPTIWSCGLMAAFWASNEIPQVQPRVAHEFAFYVQYLLA
jgi:hypothetical protein